MQDASQDQERPLAGGVLSVEEVAVETSLRPRFLTEYIGQQSVKQNLEILLAAASQRGEAADHVLLYGPPGLGKTTLANIIARELGVNLHATSGPAIERPGDLAAILTTRSPSSTRRWRGCLWPGAYPIGRRSPSTSRRCTSSRPGPRTRRPGGCGRLAVS